MALSDSDCIVLRVAAWGVRGSGAPAAAPSVTLSRLSSWSCSWLLVLVMCAASCVIPTLDRTRGDHRAIPSISTQVARQFIYERIMSD